MVGKKKKKLRQLKTTYSLRHRVNRVKWRKSEKANVKWMEGRKRREGERREREKESRERSLYSAIKSLALCIVVHHSLRYNRFQIAAFHEIIMLALLRVSVCSVCVCASGFQLKRCVCSFALLKYLNVFPFRSQRCRPQNLWFDQPRFWWSLVVD